MAIKLGLSLLSHFRIYVNRARMNESLLWMLIDVEIVFQRSVFCFCLFLDIEKFERMTMEVSSNSNRDVFPTSLQLSVEQWELLRRLRNSHLTRKQIIRAYDELDRLDRELGNLFNTAHMSTTLPSSSTVVTLNDPVSPATINAQQVSPPSSLMNNKRSHSHTTGSLPPIRSTNGYHIQHSLSNPSLRSTRNNLNDTNSHDGLNSTDLEDETRELQELLAYVQNRKNNE